MMLVDAMHLFSKQLPNMGTTYIARLVFDVEAISVLLLHHGRTVGGICSKVFMPEKFLEIVFCAVDSQYQARGYARLMMNYLKRYLQSLQLFDILTCADNEAVVYFRKQGFNKHEILMDPRRWVGCIKDYDGVTLVHCRICPDIDYLRFSVVLEQQIALVQNKSGVFVSDPLDRLVPPFLPFPQSPVFVNVSIPDLLAGYDPVGGAVERPGVRDWDKHMTRMEALRDRLLELLDSLKEDPTFAAVFSRPVTEEIAPGYFATIKRPMDFLTIEKRLLRYPDYYKRPEVFAADIHLMCDNCKKFNTPDTTYYKSAVDLMKKFRELYEATFPDYPLPPGG
jgi:histone acetyltransferase